MEKKVAAQVTVPLHRPLHRALAPPFKTPIKSTLAVYALRAADEQQCDHQSRDEGIIGCLVQGEIHGQVPLTQCHISCGDRLR